MLYVLATSIRKTKLQSLETDVQRIAFVEIRMPSIHLNDELHNHRRDLADLRAEVTKTIKYVPGSVRQPPLIRTTFSDEPLLDILEGANTTERLLIDTFQLLMSSISILDSQKSIEQNQRGQRLTQLAFIYIPLSFVTGVFGMNVKEINGSPLSIWVAVVALVITAVCTALMFGAYRQWENWTNRKLPDRRPKTVA